MRNYRAMRLLLLVLACGCTLAQAVKKDYRAEPFRVAVAFGDSITAGGTATSPGLTWVSLLGDLINGSQSQPVQMINNGIGATVISSRSAAYASTEKPSALERYRDHIVEYQPDLVVIAYGVNDARAGTPLKQFLEDERQIVLAVKKQTSALVLIVGMYFETAFDRKEYAPFDKANVSTFLQFNLGLQQLARETDCLFADVFQAQGMAPWTMDPVDGVHPNNLGHRLIANRIFEVLANNCSAMSARSMELRRDFKPWRPTRELQIQREFNEKHRK
jgi:lysophospholipase L1-like esterase